MSEPVELQLSITSMVIVGATWTRAGRTSARQFMMPLHVRGTPAECLPRVVAGMESILVDLVHQVEASGRSAAKGFTYRFPRMGELLEGSLANAGPQFAPIREVTPEERAAVAKMLKGEG